MDTEPMFDKHLNTKNNECVSVVGSIKGMNLDDNSASDSLLDTTRDCLSLDSVGDREDLSGSLSSMEDCYKSSKFQSGQDVEFCRPRSSSFTQGTVKSTAIVKYNRPQPCHFKFLQLNYNTNLKKPPENWLRMKSSTGSSGHSHYSGKFGSYFWSYPFSKSHSWSMFSSFRYGLRGKRKTRYTSLCLCCGCCNCTHINQTYCCCCYHCVHTISSCRRTDLIKQQTVKEVTVASNNTNTGSESGLESGSESLSETISQKSPIQTRLPRKPLAPKPQSISNDV